MVMVRATARDLAAAGAPFPLPPPHHLLLPHTWPGAADASSARSPRLYGHQVARVRGSPASLLGDLETRPRSSAPAYCSMGFSRPLLGRIMKI